MFKILIMFRTRTNEVFWCYTMFDLVKLASQKNLVILSRTTADEVQCQ